MRKKKETKDNELGANRHVTGDLSLRVGQGGDVGQHPVVVAILAPVDDARPGLALGNGGPHVPKGFFGHVRVADHVVRLTQHVLPAKATDLKKGRVAIEDATLQVGGRDQGLAGREGELTLGDGQVVAHGAQVPWWQGRRNRLNSGRSGLGGLADRIAGQSCVPYGEIPGFVETGVVGHAGQLIHGTLGNQEVVALAGRFHMYEGHDATTAAFPIRLLHALGAGILVVSNAAGGVRRTFAAGDLMAIADHINLTARNPLIGAVVPGDDRFPDMSQAYDAALRQELHAVARDLGVVLHDGVYCGLTGPSYETPAEVRMLERLGADAVGMSTVAEVVVARAMGMRVLGISCIANPAGGALTRPADARRRDDGHSTSGREIC